MRVEFSARDREISSVEQSAINSVIARFSRYFQLPAKTGISVVFLSRGELQQLNRTFRQKNKPTTVLTFALERLSPAKRLARQMSRLAVGQPRVLLGEILLCRPEIKKYARHSAQPYLTALKYLLLHGCLHLLGYHHANPQAEKRMNQQLSKIRNELF